MTYRQWWTGVGMLAIMAALSCWGATLVYSRPRGGPVNIALPEPSDRFEGKQAIAYLRDICKLGPRMTATPAMATQQTLLRRHFEALGAKVEFQEFQGTQPSVRQPFPCVNVVVRWHPDAQRRVLLGAHYDTRPLADQEALPQNRGIPIIGANDGASGVAFLMELGRLMPNLQLEVGVDFVLFDAEEYIFAPQRDQYFLGSEHFVREYNNRSKEFQYRAVIVLDMIADRNLRIQPDQRSLARAGWLVKDVWTIAHELRVREFDTRTHPLDLLDDHVSFHKGNIPAIVLIDFDYPHWHRLSDTPDKCSGESMEKVSRVIVEWLKRQKKNAVD